jgi:hypothetical protein
LVFAKPKNSHPKPPRAFGRFLPPGKTKLPFFGVSEAQERPTAADARTWLKDLINTNP